jgi:hypothetical protein
MRVISWLAVKLLAFHGGLLYFTDFVCQAVIVYSGIPKILYALLIFCMLDTCLLLVILLGLIPMNFDKLE